MASTHWYIVAHYSTCWLMHDVSTIDWRTVAMDCPFFRCSCTYHNNNNLLFMSSLHLSQWQHWGFYSETCTYAGTSCMKNKGVGAAAAGAAMAAPLFDQTKICFIHLRCRAFNCQQQTRQIGLQARTQVIEKVGYILVRTECARAKARHLGGSGSMLPQGNFGFLDLLRSFLMHFWSNKVPANANCTWLAKTVTISGMRPDSSCIQGWWEIAASTACCAVESVFMHIDRIL